MTDTGSVTVWIDRLKAGEPQSSQELWERYVDRLLRLARKKFGQAPRRATDEEDVVLSAFDGFFRGVEESRFPQLEDRDDLWQLLVMLTDRKTIDHRRRELAAKRGGGDVRGESAIAERQTQNSDKPGLSQIIDGEPSPEFAAQFAEQVEQLLALLADDTLRKIALAKMEGFTNAELARDLGLNVRSIERKLHLIRRTWQHEEIS
jgi:DNA-directed RNA polymerase specialized sigma24 family protein